MRLDWKDIDAALMLLVEAYPNCFTSEQYLLHRPLKVGIDRDLAERCPALDRRERGAALQFYTSRVMYLQSLVEGVDRVDLDGRAVGTVTSADATHAVTRLASILVKRETKVVAAKTARKPEKADRSAVPTASPTSTSSPAVSPALPISVAKLRDKPVLTLPAFKRKAGGSA